MSSRDAPRLRPRSRASPTATPSRAHPRRDRHRQGAHRARHPRSQPPQGRPVRRHQLRGGPARTSSRASCSATQRGAFTDAKQQRTGLFLQASGGTLFLDEIGELPLEVQPKLLRALQERQGASGRRRTRRSRSTRAIVTATNRDLEDEVYEKRFREDLFYRINVVKIDVPPLRERGGDVLHLAQHFLTQFADAQRQGRRSSSRRPPPRSSWPTRGPATSASSRTASSARWRSRASTRSRSRICPRRSAPTAPRRFVVAANEPDGDRHHRRARAALHPARALARRRQQVARRAGARLRSPHAVSQARTLRRRERARRGRVGAAARRSDLRARAADKRTKRESERRRGNVSSLVRENLGRSARGGLGGRVLGGRIAPQTSGADAVLSLKLLQRALDAGAPLFAIVDPGVHVHLHRASGFCRFDAAGRSQRARRDPREVARA